MKANLIIATAILTVLAAISNAQASNRAAVESALTLTAKKSKVVSTGARGESAITADVTSTRQVLEEAARHSRINQCKEWCSEACEEDASLKEECFEICQDVYEDGQVSYSESMSLMSSHLACLSAEADSDRGETAIPADATANLEELQRQLKIFSCQNACHARYDGCKEPDFTSSCLDFCEEHDGELPYYSNICKIK